MNTRIVRLLVSSLGFVLLTACGGGGDSPPSNDPPRNPPVNPPVTNPCASLGIEESDVLSPLSTSPAAQRKRTPRGTGDPRGDVLEELWTHRAALTLGLTQALETGLPRR